MKVYGIANCTTVKKARTWLDDQGVDYTFVDFHRTPPSAGQLRHWIDALGWERVLNRRGTTWRKLDPQVQAGIVDADSAVAVLLEHPAAIKRPVVETDSPLTLLVGFDPDEYAQRFGARGRRSASRA